MAAKKWYLIRHKKESSWTAYQLYKTQLEKLRPGYKWKGPYKSIVQCLIHNK